MAVWLEVYCTRPIGHVTAADLSSALHAADLYTIAEGFGIDDEVRVVDEAMSQLKIEPARSPGSVRFELRYGGESSSPVLVHVRSESSEVRGLCDEVLDELASVKTVGADRVRRGLQQSVEIVDLELRTSQLGDMGIVLAGQIAEAFASAGSGLIRDQNNDWWVVEDGVPVPILETRRAT